MELLRKSLILFLLLIINSRFILAQGCNSTIEEITGIITSPGYPSDYERNINCLYQFNQKTGFCGVEVTFKEFDLEYTQYCLEDKLTIKGIKYCGQSLIGKKVHLDLPSTVQLQTDDEGTSRGFLATYRFVACDNGCNVVLNDLNGTIRSGKNLRHYQNHLNCSYSFPKKVGYCGVKFMFSDFFLQQSHVCKNDKLIIGNFQHCGSSLRNKIISERLPATMSFLTDDKVTAKGFEVSYSYTNTCKSVCEQHYTTKYGYMDPPISDVDHYHNDMYCTYVIHKVNNAACVKLTFLKLEICNSNDYIQIQGQKYCKNPRKEPLQVFAQFENHKNEIGVEFISDGNMTTTDGFFLKYEQIESTAECPKRKCQPALTGKVGILNNPDYPWQYSNDDICEYVIVPYEDSTSAFIILTAPLGDGDALYIDRGDQRTQLVYDKALKVPFPSKNGTLEPIVIELKSDSKSQAEFQISVSQV